MGKRTSLRSADAMCRPKRRHMDSAEPRGSSFEPRNAGKAWKKATTSSDLPVAIEAFMVEGFFRSITCEEGA